MDTDHPLRQWRKREGAWREREGGVMTLEDLAAAIGVAPSQLSQIETGKRKPSLGLAARLSKATAIPLDHFVREVAQ